MNSFIIIFSLILFQKGYAGPFSLKEEFPNYFLENHVSLSPSILEGLVQESMASILKRLQIPYFKEDQMQTNGFFKALQVAIHEKSLGATIYLGGGGVRSLMGYLYQEIEQAKRADPQNTTQMILEQIIQSRALIPPLLVLGAGSDLDLLLTLKDSSTLAVAKSTALAFINSAETQTHLRAMTSDLKRSLVPVGDVKEYAEQTGYASRQGGSRLDLLAFDLGTQRIQNPPHYPDVFRDLLAGFYDYDPPESQRWVKDSAKQTIRGLRPLSELPFIQLSPSGQSQLLQELKQLTQSAASADLSLSPDALKQIEKFVRNGRFSCAHNRVYRSEAVVEKQFCQFLETLQIAEARYHPENHTRTRLVPEFIETIHLSTRKVRDFSSDLLMSMKEFKSKYTHEGILYHGTRLEHALAILRNGLIVSDEKKGQGTSVYGRGAYTSPSFYTACTYGGGDFGCVLRIGVKEEPQTRIINLEQIQNTRQFQDIQAQAKIEGQDLHEYLAREYGIDILVTLKAVDRAMVLIQNSAVLELPQNMGDLIQMHLNHLEGQMIHLDQLDPNQLANVIQSLKQYQEMHALAKSVGQAEKLKPFHTVVQDLLKIYTQRLASDFQTAHATPLQSSGVTLDPVFLANLIQYQDVLNLANEESWQKQNLPLRGFTSFQKASVFCNEIAFSSCRVRSLPASKIQPVTTLI